MKKDISKIKWCDLSCKYAEFPKDHSLSGDCRTLSTLYCKKHRTLVQKNSPCIETAKRGKI